MTHYNDFSIDKNCSKTLFEIQTQPEQVFSIFHFFVVFIFAYILEVLGGYPFSGYTLEIL